MVEVEELTANEEDKRLRAYMKAGRITTTGSVVGNRVRAHIREASKQLRSHREEALPSVVVLYDNICVDGERHAFPYTDLMTFQIDAAMYGFIQATLVLGNGGVIGSKADRAGPNRTTTEREKRYLSAVCVLYDTPKLWMLTYHNYYAAIRLPLSVFAGPSDAHLKKPRDPNCCPGAWEKA